MPGVFNVVVAGTVSQAREEAEGHRNYLLHAVAGVNHHNSIALIGQLMAETDKLGGVDRTVLLPGPAAVTTANSALVRGQAGLLAGALDGFRGDHNI